MNSDVTASAAASSHGGAGSTAASSVHYPTRASHTPVSTAPASPSDIARGGSGRLSEASVASSVVAASPGLLVKVRAAWGLLH